MDMPNAPEGPTYREKIRLRSYPCQEAGDLIWAYMGPVENQPPFPHFEWTNLPSSHRYVTKYELECNYLQAMEGDFDQTHARFLHSTLDNNASSPGNDLRGANNDQLRALSGPSEADEPFPRAVGPRRVRELPWLDVTDNEAGMWLLTKGTQPDGRKYVMANQAWIMPVFSQIGLAGPNTNSINIRVPIDNASMTIFRLRWSTNPISAKELADYKHSGYSYPELIPGTWRLKDNIHNDYNIDRVAQRSFSYTGIKAFPTQDVALVENQWGAIADRTQEHLASSDQQIIHIRHRLLATARALFEGTEPLEPQHPECYGFLRGSAAYEDEAGLPAALEAAKRKAMGQAAAPVVK
jgi:phenylpropionate dioxygenase-like ring-hydroxylating dioxygenase large terminal subunit